ncbi:MAG: right-handed parallel beta-helix repeat-containing protein [Methanomassiliicoccaceae archaeon]|nr:right-handed parallel beta-helix repeat-containing protein [Methanomassiliicoccaceae archaeon]
MAQKSLLIIAVLLVTAAVVIAAVAIPKNSDQDSENNWTAPTIPPIGAFDGVGPRGNNYDDPAGGIYVSPSGNDQTADGSINRPYKSINTALGVAEPGDTIILRSGVYKEGYNVRVQVSDITIKSAKGEWAVIDLTTFDPGNEEHSAIEFYAEDRNGGVVSNCLLQAVEVRGGYYAVCFETKWEWGQSDRRGVHDIIVEDCVLHDSKNDVVKVKPNCDNITIRYNEIYNSGRDYVKHPDFTTGECNSEGIDNVNGDNMKVQNNYIHDICSNAIYAKGGAINSLIENNRIERAYGAGIMAGFDTSPQYFDTSVNSQYYENINGVIRNNLIIHTGWEGIGLYGSKDAQIYNNTLVDVNYAQNYHSAIYFGLTYQDWESYAGRPANIDPNIHHNIVSQPATFTQRPMIEIRYSSDLGGMSALSGNPTMSNNCYYIDGKNAEFVDMRSAGINPNMGLAEWKSRISGDSGSIEVNPGLDANYKPTNSLCAGMGCNFL